MLDFTENTFDNDRNSVVKKFWYLTGDDWLRQGDQCIYVHGGSGFLPKKIQTLSANKTARGVLSPIQAKDLGLVFA